MIAAEAAVVCVMLFSSALYGRRASRVKVAKNMNPSSAAVMLPPSMMEILSPV